MTLVLLLALLFAKTAGAQPAEQIYSSAEVVPPRPTSQVKPAYTREALAARITGSVALEGVVRPDGHVSDIRVVRSLDPGLDAEAIKAFGQWRFSPGLKDGTPVPVRISLDMTFSLTDAAAAPAGDKPVIVTVIRGADGHVTVFELPPDRLRSLPEWDPARIPAPPLALEDAIRIATDWNRKRSGASYRLLGAGFARIGGAESNRWFYQVNLGGGAVAPGSQAGEVVNVIVLLDGSVVEPRVEK